MSRTALSEEAMRDSLLDIRLPAETAFGPYADLLVAAGLGGCAAIVVIGLLRLVTRRQERVVEIALSDRIAGLQALPKDARRVGFLHLLKEVDPQRFAALRSDLYKQGNEVDPEGEVLSRV